MLNLVTDVVSHIVEADDHAKLHAAIQFGILELDFDSYNLSCNKQSKYQFMLEPTLTSWSQEDLKLYDAGQWYELDPLLAYAAGKGEPKAWTPQDWGGSQQLDEFVDYLDQVGIVSGVTAPLSKRAGTMSAITALSLSRDRVSADIVNAVYVIGQTAMLRADVLGLLEPPRIARQPVAAPLGGLGLLSQQQLEILEWVKLGKSNGDIALITGSSKRAVSYHMSQILGKLGVSTRAQAVATYSSQ